MPHPPDVTHRLPGLALALALGCLLPASESAPGGASATQLVTSTEGSSTAASSSTTSITGASLTPELTSAAHTSLPGPDAPSAPDLEAPECEVYAQDCPQGQKCVWTGPTDEPWFPSWTTCVPVAPDPLEPGEACAYDLDHPFSGLDDCARGSQCLEGKFGPEYDGVGTCSALCLGSIEHPYCEAGFVCVGGRVLWVCEPICDPLVQDCELGWRCDIYGAATLCLSDWVDGPQRPAGEPCQADEECHVGLTCLPGAVPGCADEACCTPFCDRLDPQATCPFPDQKCLAPWDPEAEPAGVEHVGVCRPESWP